jgi:hypothetical protein
LLFVVIPLYDLLDLEALEWAKRAVLELVIVVGDRRCEPVMVN